MTYKIALSVGFILAAAIPFLAQTKVVTNATLEKYKQQRMAAEREYRENYERLGLPSPEELERRREQSRVETEALSAKLRAENMERERLVVQRETNERFAAGHYRNSAVPVDQVYREPNYFWSYGRRYRYPPRQTYYQQPGYFAGGQFWPTGSRTESRPLIKIRHR